MGETGSSHDLTDLIRHYESCLERHGATPQGVDWPNARDLARRFDVMLGLIAPGTAPVELLDLGCGPGLFYDHILRHPDAGRISYRGVDLSEKMIAAAQARHSPALFATRDVLTDPPASDSTDYVVLCGVLTERQSMPQSAMESFAKDILKAAFRSARVGIAFNAMSTHVDWTRDDLFHWGLDDIGTFLCKDVSRHFVIRNDYGLFENTVYVYKSAWTGEIFE